MTAPRGSLVNRRRLLALVLLAVASVYGLQRLPTWSAALLSHGLATFFDRSASVGAVRFHLIPLEVEVRDVRVAGPTAAAPAFLEIPRLVAAPALSPFWVGEVVLSRLVIQGAQVRVHAFAGGGDDLPHIRGGAGGLGIRVQRLTFERGDLLLNHERIPLDLDLPAFRGRLALQRAGSLGGALAFGPGEARFGEGPPLSMGTEMDLILDGSNVTVTAAHLTARGTDLAYSGRLSLASPLHGEMTLAGVADLGVLDQYVARTGLDLRGSGRFEGRLAIESSRFAVEGAIEGRDGSFRGVGVPRFAGRVAWSDEMLRIRDLDVSVLGGTARLDVDVPGKRGQARLKGRLEGLDAEGLLMAVFSVGAAGVDAAARGDVSIEWPRGSIRHLSGEITADLAPRGDGRTPLSGRLEWRAEKGVERFDKADLRTPSTWARITGLLDADDRADLGLDAESVDLAATDDLLVRLRRALGVAKVEASGLGGEGAFQGRWRGALGAPVFEGRFSGRQISYLGVAWGAAEWAGTATSDEIISRSLVLRRRPGGELWLDGRTETGEYGLRDGIDVRVRIRQWPAMDFVRVLGWKIEAGGLVTGEATVSGRRSAPVGSVHVTSGEGRWSALPFEALDVDAQLRGATSEISSGHAQVGGGSVSFKGVRAADGSYDAVAEAESVDASGFLPPVATGATWGGRVSGKLSLSGPLEHPRIIGEVTSPHLFLGDEGLGSIQGTIGGGEDGVATLDVRCHSPRVDLSVSGTVGLSTPHLASLRFSARDTSLDPFVRAVYAKLPSAVAIVTSGEAHLEGPLDSPEGLEGDVALTAFEIGLPEFEARSREPLRARLANGSLAVRELHLTGEGTDLAVSGTAAVVGDGAIALTARGAADLGVLGGLSRRVRARGAASLALQIVGTRRLPTVDGRLDIDGAGVRVPGFPHGLENVHGAVRFTESTAQLLETTGTIGGGDVTLEGQAAYGPEHTPSFEVRASGRGMAIRYPEGLRSVLDADLRIFGDEKAQWVAGEIDVRQAAWTKRYDLASELLAGAPVSEATGGSAAGVRFDIKIHAPATLTVNNNLATLVARADLTLQGTEGNPAVLGRAEIDRGRVYFQGSTYVIRRGTIDFANPQKLDPLFDIEAETRLGSYRITLKVNGTLERVYPTLTSDPPLSAMQILNLMAGADESTVASLQTQADQARLAATGAATLAAGKIAEEVGLEKGVEKLLGLNRFSIDPSIVRATNPTARLTVGKRITPDVNVVYSVDLRGTEQRVLTVEYTLSDRLSVLLTSSDLEGLGFDLRLHHSR
ncbi:MAG: translocation/assembly module TamB domain-containing protein [Vicinamibacteria bacterium]